MTRIRTFTGRWFTPLSPRAEDVCLEDIAHHLACKCRWTGACREPYSIAQHSVMVAYRACDAARAAGWSRAEAAMVGVHGLLHDAAEAYLPDVAAPIKSHFRVYSAGIRSFREAESAVLDVVYLALSLPTVNSALDFEVQAWRFVHDADQRAAATEARDLMHGTGWWAHPAEPYSETIRPQPWHVAKAEWLMAYRDLRAVVDAGTVTP